MDIKILAVLVAVVAVSAGAVAVALHQGSGSGDDPELTTVSGYALLDHPEKISAGQVITYHYDDAVHPTDDVTTVTAVDDKMVYYKENSVSKTDGFAALGSQLSDFTPEMFPFYYDDPEYGLPEGIEVTYSSGVTTINGSSVTTLVTLTFDQVTIAKDGSTYTMSGKVTNVHHNVAETYTTVYTYDSLAVTYDGTSVSEVAGSYTETTIYESDDEVRKTVLSEEVKTEGTTVLSDQCITKDNTGAYGRSIAVSSICGYKYSGDAPSGVTVTETSGTFGGVDVTIYTYNGTSGNHVYADYAYYVHNGYILKEEGTFDGHSLQTLLTIS